MQPFSSRRWTSVALAIATTAGYASAQISCQPAATTSGQTTSVILSPSYAGVGIEPANLPAFTGTNSVNQLSYNLLSTLGNYTGVPPHLRIGGNSGDNMLYDPNLSQALMPNPNPSGQGNTATDSLFIGPQFFAALDRMPANTPITYGLNLAYTGADAQNRTIAMADAVMNNLKNVHVVGLEIGNEPDLYIVNGYRQAGYTVNTFGKEWGTRAAAVYNAVLKPKNYPTNFFEPATTATTASNSGNAYRIKNLVNTGVAVDNGIYVAGWNQHDYYYYVGVSSFTLTIDYVLDLSNTYNQFNEWVNQAAEAGVTGKPYYLREMGSVGPTGIQGISDTFGNTLWTFNFFLYAATVQISSVQMHMTQNSYASPWQPIEFGGEGPHVRSLYYAFAAMSQIVGSKCNTKIASLTLNGVGGQYYNHMAAYSIYHSDTLSGIVLLNTVNAPNGAQKNMAYVSVSVPQYAGQTFYVSKLSAPGTDSTTNTTWNGISYEQNGNGTPSSTGETATAIVVGADGTLTLPVRDASAIVAMLGAPVGSNNTVDAAACAALASNSGESGETSPSSTGKAPAPTFKSTTGFSGDGQMPTGTIVGIAVGAFAAVLLLGLAVFIMMVVRQRRRIRRASLAVAPYAMGNTSSPGGVKPAMLERGRSARTPYARPDLSAAPRPSGETLFYSENQHEDQYGNDSPNQHLYSPPVGHGMRSSYGHTRTDSGGAATPTSSLRTFNYNDANHPPKGSMDSRR